MDELRGSAGIEPADGLRFELRFRVGVRDFLALQRRLRRTALERSVKFVDAAGVVAAGALVGSFLWLTFEDAMPDLPAAIDGQFVTILAGAVGLLAFRRFVLHPLFFRSYFAGQPIGMGETVVIADAAGVKTTSAGIDIGTTWQHVIAIIETADHLFLLFARLGGFIIPKRACENPDQLKRLVQFARAMAPRAR